MNREYVESPVLGISRLVADNHRVVDANCPICEAKLVSVAEYDFTEYLCYCCNSRYPRTTDVSTLKSAAQHYLKMQKDSLEKKKVEVSGLEKIVELGKTRGLL